MKLPDKEQFQYKDCVIAGDDCWLIVPNSMGTEWNDENARFRSCIVRKSDNFVVSQGFQKFVNWGEKPDFQPWDMSWKFEARHKLDGSLLIVSNYKGNLIIRTRGTVDARQLPNGKEINFLEKKYDKFFSSFKNSGGLKTFLFEWTTLSNVIVLREHDEPTLTLVGMVYNDTGEYESQENLDIIGRIYGIGRPEKYEYNSVAECLEDVKAWEGKEGVVIYSPDGQTLKKIKAEQYLTLHKLRTGMTSIYNIWDAFLESPRSTIPGEFYKYVETTIDYEVAFKCKEHIEKVVDIYTMILQRMDDMDEFVCSISYKSFSRKDLARYILAFSTASWEKAYMFLLLDAKPIDNKLLTKAFEYYYEKENSF